ncbi:MAG TPA: SRPBCC family protein [Bacteroidales bacterium]|nr:SRPBCC family protein [Bacteroidales bacterium]
MAKVESKIGALRQNEDQVYDFLNDFRNLDPLVPQDKVSNWESTQDTCRFDIAGAGSIAMEIIEREPHKLIKLRSKDQSPVPFTLWMQIKQVKERDTRIKLTAKAEMNPFMKAMLTKHLKKGLDGIVDKLSEYFGDTSGL